MYAVLLDTKTEITANIGRAKVFLVRMHSVPETNESDDIFTKLAATLCWIHRSIASLNTSHTVKITS